MINEKEIIDEIFERIDKIIKNCISKEPKPFNESKFKKEYNNLKKEYE